MSKPDVNWISYTGDAAGNIWRNGLHLFGPGDSPGIRAYSEGNITLPPGGKIADVLKFSGVQRLRVVVRGELPGGTEDCIDINNGCRDLEVQLLKGMRPAGQYAVTIKGGSRNVRIEGTILGPARTVEVDLGNHSDQSQEPTTGVHLALVPAYQGKIRYRQLNASTPLLVPAVFYRRTFRLRGFFRPIFARLYALLKRIGLPI